uniref:Uncharacterized protein n=1 Tax=Salix viminalis TaxID=40686 RepID=A0A6N2MXP6_SALVM
MESENPDDRQRIAAAEEQKKRKRSESNKKYREKIKKERKQAQSKTVQNESSRCKAQLESFEKSVMKPFLDEACKFSKLVLETGESSGHAIEAVEKQTDLMNSLSWELLKTTFNEHRELYIASEAQHAQEKVTLLKLHAQEMAATEDHHAQEMAEMAAAAALHAREMDAAGIVGFETQYGTFHVKLLPDCAPHSISYVLELLASRHCVGCHFYRAESRGKSWDLEGNHIEHSLYQIFVSLSTPSRPILDFPFDR